MSIEFCILIFKKNLAVVTTQKGISAKKKFCDHACQDKNLLVKIDGFFSLPFSVFKEEDLIDGD